MNSKKSGGEKTHHMVVVDDDQLDLKIIKKTILRCFADIEITCINTHDDLLEYVANVRNEETKPPTVAVVDLQMPVLSGEDVSRALASISPGCEIWIHTSQLKSRPPFSIESGKETHKYKDVFEKDGSCKNLISRLRAHFGSLPIQGA